MPDIPNYSWGEYGMRCGVQRLLDIFGERDIKASAFLNLEVIRSYPVLAERIQGAGWEFVGHGVRQEALSEENETQIVEECIEGIKSFTGSPPRGWVGPGLRETVHTPDVLARSGLDFVLDWAIDDLPNWMKTLHGPLMMMPYTLELNDSVIYAVEKHTSAEQYNRVRDTVSVLEREVATSPKVLTITLHHHLMGVPHRAAYVMRMLDLLQARDDTVFMTAGEVYDWYKAQVPPAADTEAVQ